MRKKEENKVTCNAHIELNCVRIARRSSSSSTKKAIYLRHTSSPNDGVFGGISQFPLAAKAFCSEAREGKKEEEQENNTHCLAVTLVFGLYVLPSSHMNVLGRHTEETCVCPSCPILPPCGLFIHHWTRAR